jgi:hypothetical protein
MLLTAHNKEEKEIDRLRHNYFFLNRLTMLNPCVIGSFNHILVRNFASDPGQITNFWKAQMQVGETFSSSSKQVL